MPAPRAPHARRARPPAGAAVRRICFPLGVSRPRALAGALVLAALTGAPAAAQPVTLAPGISYERIARDGQVIHLLVVRPGPLVGLDVGYMAGTPAQRATLTGALRSQNATGEVAGVNGDYFNLANAYPSGILALPGELGDEPEPTRSALVLPPSGPIEVMRLSLVGRYQVLDPTLIPPAPPRGFVGVNRPFERSSEAVVFTPRYGPATPRCTRCVEAAVAMDGGATLAPNREQLGTVLSVREGTGGTPLAPGQLVIAADGGAGTTLRGDLAPGRRVSVTATIAGLPDGAQALGGGPELVHNGVPVISSGEGFTAGQLSQRTARTAIGQRADGAYLLVTTEGPQQGHPGFSVPEQARLMASLGAVEAIGMDSGGSALMALGDRLVIPWRSERPITTGLVVRYRGVRIDPLPVGRLSPNGDRVDDTEDALVHSPAPGTLRVSLVRRGSRGPGATIVQGPVGPGALDVRVDPRALGVKDGPFVLRAQLTPTDGTAPSAQSRSVIVDRTLGFLRLRPHGRGRHRVVSASFTLARPARVTMKVLRAGRVVRIPVAGRALRRGHRVLTWDATIRRRPVAGVFRVQVEARTFLGATTLTRSVHLAPARIRIVRRHHPGRHRRG